MPVEVVEAAKTFKPLKQFPPIDKFAITSNFPGRVRIRIPALWRNVEMKEQMAQIFAIKGGVRKVSVNIFSKTLLLSFDPHCVSTAELVQQLQTILIGAYSDEGRVRNTLSGKCCNEWHVAESSEVDDVKDVENQFSESQQLSSTLNAYIQHHPTFSLNTCAQQHTAGIRNTSKPTNYVNPHKANLSTLFADARQATASTVEVDLLEMSRLSETANIMPMRDQWHQLTPVQTANLLASNVKTGLATQQIESLLHQHGLNEFTKKSSPSLAAMLVAQLNDFLPRLMLGASFASLLLGQIGDAITIASIVLVEGVLGVWQNRKAEKSLETLRQLSATHAKVVRSGTVQKVPAHLLVPGDLICLEAGDLVPADARLIASSHLKVNESALTGESDPVDKSHKVTYTTPLPLADRKNMLYMGTTVITGTGKAIIVYTGTQTEMGQIANMLQESEPELTPLQKDLNRLARSISLGCLGVSAGLMLIGLLKRQPILEIIRSGVSLAIGTVPEGLTAVLTVSLAFGVQRMAKKGGIVKKLPAVETLSCADIICTDKTGTLTTGTMTVTTVYTPGHLYNVSSNGTFTKAPIQPNSTPLPEMSTHYFRDNITFNENAYSPDQTECSLDTMRNSLNKNPHSLDKMEHPFNEREYSLTTMANLLNENSHFPDKMGHSCDKRDYSLNTMVNLSDENSHSLDKMEHSCDERDYSLNTMANLLNENSHSLGKMEHSLNKLNHLIEGKVTEIKQPAEVVDATQNSQLYQLLQTALLCNNATYRSETDQSDIIGDPTEGALWVLANKANFHPQEFQNFTREREIPFDAETRIMTTVCKNPAGKYTVSIKGAPDNILAMATHILTDEGVHEITQTDLTAIYGTIDQMAEDTLRVMGFAYKELDELTDDSTTYEDSLIFVGLTGMVDPPRPDVKFALEQCHQAGIRVIMITGDHQKTAEAIGRQLGILTPEQRVLTGDQLDQLTDEELTQKVEQTAIYARTTPHQKLRIVKALQANGHVVAMTGDGVNDAPAIKAADIGIAMGKSGTDVTREASSIIITDDNFSTIVNAIREGRGISNNIRHFMRYILAGNVAQVLTVVTSAVLGLPTPLLPGQILMVDLATEGITSLSLGVDPADTDTMNQPPRDAKKSLFDMTLVRPIISHGLSMGASTFALFSGTFFLTRNIPRARTIAYANLVVTQFFHLFNCRTAPIAENKLLIPSVAASSLLLLSSIYLPLFQLTLGTFPLAVTDWVLITTLGQIIHKFAQNRRKPELSQNSNYVLAVHNI